MSATLFLKTFARFRKYEALPSGWRWPACCRSKHLLRAARNAHGRRVQALIPLDHCDDRFASDKPHNQVLFGSASIQLYHDITHTGPAETDRARCILSNKMDKRRGLIERSPVPMDSPRRNLVRVHILPGHLLPLTEQGNDLLRNLVGIQVQRPALRHPIRYRLRPRSKMLQAGPFRHHLQICRKERAPATDGPPIGGRATIAISMGTDAAGLIPALRDRRCLRPRHI